MKQQVYADGALIWYFSDDDVIVSSTKDEVEQYEKMLVQANPRLLSTFNLYNKQLQKDQEWKVYLTASREDFKKIISMETLTLDMDRETKRTYWAKAQGNRAENTTWICCSPDSKYFFEIFTAEEFKEILKERMNWHRILTSQAENALALINSAIPLF